jgi:hypothetical protein
LVTYAAIIQPGERFLHGVAVLDAVDRWHEGRGARRGTGDESLKRG